AASARPRSPCPRRPPEIGTIHLRAGCARCRAIRAYQRKSNSAAQNFLDRCSCATCPSWPGRKQPRRPACVVAPTIWAQVTRTTEPHPCGGLVLTLLLGQPLTEASCFLGGKALAHRATDAFSDGGSFAAFHHCLSVTDRNRKQEIK